VNKYSNIVVLLIFLISVGVKAQVPIDTTRLSTGTHKLQTKSIVDKSIELLPDSLKPKAFKPDPNKVVWMAAIIPGAGQMLNRKYWKLPIVYGGFLGCAYAITWNSGKYNNYKQAYRDILKYNDPSFTAYTAMVNKAIADNNPGNISFLQMIPKNYTLEKFGGIDRWKEILKTRQDIYRRQRDLSIIVTVGYYAITIIEAYVDAQLYDFDISPDLSLRFQPTLFNNRTNFPNTLGLQCSLSLK